MRYYFTFALLLVAAIELGPNAALFAAGSSHSAATQGGCQWPVLGQYHAAGQKTLSLHEESVDYEDPYYRVTMSEKTGFHLRRSTISRQALVDRHTSLNALEPAAFVQLPESLCAILIDKDGYTATLISTKKDSIGIYEESNVDPPSHSAFHRNPSPLRD